MWSRADRRSYDSVGLVVVSHTQDYLRECLESVRSQTVVPSSTVVIDNGSPAERRVCDLAADLGFESVRLDNERGRSTARNIGCQLLDDCDLLVSLDGDDVLLATYVEQYASQARRHGADVVFGPAELFGAESGIAFTAQQRGPRADLRGGNFVPSNSLFRREIWRRAGGYDPSLSIFEDWDFWLSCAEQGARFHAIEEPLWRYRCHAQSTMNTVDVAQKDVARRYVRAKHLAYIRGPLQWRRVRRKIETLRASNR